MPLQRMARVYVRVIEIICRVARHTNALHDSSRALVQWHGERDDFFKCQLLEAETQRGRGCLGRVAVAPVFLCESPANFDAWGEVRLEARCRQAHEANELTIVAALHGPKTPAALLDEPLCAGNGGVTFVTGGAAREVSHDHRVRVESRERLPVSVPPLPENQTFGG